MLATASTYAVIILLEALGFVVWNIGTRSPNDVVRDIVHGVRNDRIFRANIAPFLFGGSCFVASFAFLSARLPYERNAQAFLVTLVVLAGLAVEFLIGPDLRRRWTQPGRSAR